MTDQELKELVISLAISQKKTDEQLKKTDEQLKKTDEQLKKTDEQLKKTDEQLKKLSEEMKIEHNRFRQNLEEDNRAFNKRIKKLEELVGNIGNNQGDVAEEYFVNSLKDTLEVAGMNFDILLKNVGMKLKSITDEFDILLVNGNSVALIEVKYKVHPSILDKLPKKIEHLKMMPQYKNYKVYAGIAGFFIPDEVIEEALKRGYFVLQRKGDVIQTHAMDLKAS